MTNEKQLLNEDVLEQVAGGNNQNFRCPKCGSFNLESYDVEGGKPCRIKCKDCGFDSEWFDFYYAE